MNLSKLRDSVDAAAADDPTVSTRVIVLYLAPAGGLYIHRVGVGSHLLGGDSDEDFSKSMQRAVEKLWPESTPKLRTWLRVASDMLARSPIAKIMMGAPDDEEEP